MGDCNMQLDFTAIRGEPIEKPLETTVTAFNELSGVSISVNSKSPSEGKIAPNTGEIQARRLAIQYQQEQAEKERTREMYREYQKNIIISGSLRTEIIKGARTGEPLVALLLKAVKCISIMTSDTLFYSQIEEDIKSIYGAGLLEKEPLELEIKDTRERLLRLEQALQRDTEPADSKRRIEWAIQAHRERISQLQGLIENGKTQL